MQDRKTSYRSSGGAARPLTANRLSSRRPNRHFGRRARLPTWGRRAAAGILLLIAGFAAGRSWPDGQTAVQAERLAETEVRLEQGLAELAATKSDLTDAVAERDAAGDRIAELDAEILGWAGTARLLNSETVRLERMLERQRTLMEVQTDRASRLQAAEAARIAALPNQIATSLTANPPSAKSTYRIAGRQETFSQAFGQYWWGWLDELKSVTTSGTAVFEARGPFLVRNLAAATEVKIGLPRLLAAGLNGFEADSFDYDPGFLAGIDDQNVSQLMLWVEQNLLRPKACQDVASLLKVTSAAKAQIESVAGSREVEIIWVSRSGQEFSASQLTDEVLVAESC